MKIFFAAALLFLAVPSLSAEAPNGVASRLLTLQAPTQNVDGTPLTDLRGFIYYAGFNSRSYSIQSPEQPASSLSHTLVVDVVGSFGDTVRVYYAATALDARDNESGFSNEIFDDYVIVDNQVPAPPGLSFAVSVALPCSTVEGTMCGLRRIIPSSELIAAR